MLLFYSIIMVISQQITLQHDEIRKVFAVTEESLFITATDSIFWHGLDFVRLWSLRLFFVIHKGRWMTKVYPYSL